MPSEASSLLDEADFIQFRPERPLPYRGRGRIGNLVQISFARLGDKRVDSALEAWFCKKGFSRGLFTDGSDEWEGPASVWLLKLEVR